jgi:hypothetical protein
VNKEEDGLPGANLLSEAQVSELLKQFPSRPGGQHPPSRPIAIVPFAKTTPQLFQVGQGSLSDRTVPDTNRQARTMEVQKSICKTLANNPQRPEICTRLP